MREREQVLYVEFVRARYASLYRTAYLLTGNHHTAEDVLQTALANVYVSWGRRAQGPYHPEAYVRRVVVNEVISLHRRRWTTEIAAEHPGDLPRAATDPGPEHAVVETQVVWQALKRLTARQRAVVVLRYYEDLSEAEIATLLDLAPGTVKAHAHAALGALREALPARAGAARKEERA